jgi:hypothetical protein
MSYDLFTHRHNFSVWAAARATQRGFTTVKNLRDALEHTRITEFLKDTHALDTDETRFETLHREWCRSIIGFLNERGVQNATFGRAAKLVAIYLKSMVVTGPDAGRRLASAAHPPIDRILLQNMARVDDLKSPHKDRWRITNWTELDERGYYHLVSELKACLKPNEPFWKLERYWTITNQ